MTTSIIDLAELELFTPEEAAKIMSGKTPKAVSGYWLRQQIRDGRFGYTPMGRRMMLSRQQIAAIIADCAVPASKRVAKGRHA